MKEGVEISKKIVAFNAMASAGAKLTNMFIVLWAQHILLTRLSPEEFSIYPLIAILVYFLPMLATSFTSPAQRYVTAACASNDSDEITEVISTLVSILAIPVAIILGGGALLLTFLDHVFEIPTSSLGEARLMFGLIIVGSAIKLWLQPFCVGFYAKQRLVLFNLMNVGGELVRLLTLGTLFYCFGARVLWVVVADTLVSVGLAGVLAVVSRRMMPDLRFRGSMVRPDRLPEFMSFGVYYTGIQFSRMMRSSIPIFLLNRLSTPAAVNSFHVAQSAYRQTQKAWIPMRDTLGPPMTAMHATGQDDRLRRTYYKGGRFAIWMVMAICTPLIVFNQEIILLYAGDAYPAAGAVMAALLLRYPLQMMNALLPHLARARGIPGAIAKPLIIIELISAIVVAVAIIGFGCEALGAAICLLAVSAFAELVVLLPIANRLLDGSYLRAMRQSLIPGFAPSLISGLVMLLTRNIASPSGVVELLAAMTPGLILYVAGIFVMMQADDRDDLRDVLHVVQKRFGYAKA